MRSIVLALAFAIPMVAQSVLADDPPAPQQPPMPVPERAEEQTTLPKDQLDHLKTAAEHLAKAGRTEDADKLREQIQAMESGQAKELLAKKEKELHALSQEIDQLRRLVDRREAVVLGFYVMQIPVQNIKLPGVQVLLGSTEEGAGIGQISQTPAAVDSMIDGMRKKGLVRVLASPKIATLVGENASFRSGGEVPVRRLGKDGTVVTESVEVGTRLEVKPTLKSSGKVLLPLYIRICQQQPVGVQQLNELQAPRFDIVEVQAPIEMELDHAFVVHGLKTRRTQPTPDTAAKSAQQSEISETILIVTAERLDRTKQAAVRTADPLQNGSYAPARAAAAPLVPKTIR